MRRASVAGRSTTKLTSTRKSRYQPGSASFASAETFVLGIVLALAIVAVYYPVHNHPFVNYDDEGYVTKNTAIQSGLNWQTVSWAFTTYHESNWHPLTWLSHALDYQFFGLNPAGHHDKNLLLHVLNALLLFLVLRRATGTLGPSFMVAALFALHPLNVESVAWIAERKNLLSMLFLLLALGAYGWYVRKPGVGRYAVVAVLFALGLMAKPQIVTFPFVLLLWDYWPLGRMSIGVKDSSATLPLAQRSFWWLLREKLPLIVLAAASAGITMRAQRAGGAVASLTQHPLSVRLQNAAVSYIRYISKVFWPSQLAPLYPYPADTFPAALVVGASLLSLVISLLVLRYRQHRYLPVGWFWFLGTMVPMIGLVQVGSQAMADRYAYLPCVGLFLMICWGVADWAKQQHLPRAVMPVVSSVVLLMLGFATRHQINYWSDNVTLWSHAIAVTGGNYIAQDNLGFALLQGGDADGATEHFQAALRIMPSDPTSLFKTAMFEQQRKNFPEALERYNTLLGLTQNIAMRATVLTNMGYVYRNLHDMERAQASWQQAVDLDAESARAWIGLGLVAQESGNLSAAIRNYSQGVDVQPSDVGYLLLAQALEKAGRTGEAQKPRQQASQLSRNLREAQRVAEGLLGR
jgi:Flp pilus assembly protein TadD